MVVVGTAFIINLRHALYSASVAPFIKHLSPLWKGILAYLLTDEAYVIGISHYEQPGSSKGREWYFLGAGLTLWISWQISTALGIFLGTQVPASWQLDFTLALTFIALAIPLLKEKATVLAAGTAGLVALAAYGLPYKLGLILAAIAGIAAGMISEGAWKRSG
jgi:predicted branched-subunit amino acid permease